MEEILKFAERNAWAAFGIGLMAGLWLLGGIEEKVKQGEVWDALPDFDTDDDEIAWHEKRIEILKTERDKSRQQEELIEEFHTIVNEMKSRIESLEKEKGR